MFIFFELVPWVPCEVLLFCVSSLVWPHLPAKSDPDVDLSAHPQAMLAAVGVPSVGAPGVPLRGDCRPALLGSKTRPEAGPSYEQPRATTLPPN